MPGCPVVFFHCSSFLLQCDHLFTVSVWGAGHSVETQKINKITTPLTLQHKDQAPITKY